ncbi:aminodeoxychorismate synthase component I [Streptomyces bungoensis]|uniref:aminodeoxychorismate synthase component I n=1 Tax=Streptomyces bungoensis TaxID=285568 RepID=UPI003431CBF6
MRTLLVDNHDSYSFNLFQLIAQVTGVDPLVVVNDDPALARMPLDGFDNIVISPGPGRPQNGRDLGYAGDLLQRTNLPVLGVCLGHQAIAHLAGGSVIPAPQPRHGHLTTVKHADDELFAGIPTEFTAVRYHSLCVQEPLPDTLIATARAEDGVIMALRHRDLPRWGVQFHPESIASEFGREIVANFTELTHRTAAARVRTGGKPPATHARADAQPPATQARSGEQPETAGSGPAGRLRVLSTDLPEAVDTEAVFLELFADSPNSFWLDSSRVEAGLSRFSFLGDATGPLSEVLTYRVDAKAVKARDASGVRVLSGSVFDVLEARLRERAVDPGSLPFDLTGGYVGYFGYELKAECGASARHTADTPDAAWMLADRLIAVDHLENRTYVLSLHDERTEDEARAWVERTAARLVRLRPAPAPEHADAGPAADPAAYLVRGQAGYEDDVRAAQRQLIRGESYEICLTNKLHLPFEDDDTAFYRRLRRLNPAPYSAFLRIDGVTVFCSSPERFLRIERDGRVESKPIKGTAPRDADPERDALLAAGLRADAKTQAENLMIVDLLRNDLGQVCEVGSVHVDPYMAVESYQTVHQLVSTVKGRLRDSVGAVECVRRCFPGGSMTGAPKLRTMEIIDRLETEARGVYSGTLGYFGLSGGTDLNIVIRTAVRKGDDLSIGAGGAIVLDSDPHDEYQEMILKADAPLRAYRAPLPARAGTAAR